MTPLELLGAAILTICFAPVVGLCIGWVIGKRGYDLFPYTFLPVLVVYGASIFVGLARFGWALFSGEIK